MKILLLFMCVVFLFSCKSKWDKEYLSSKCNKEMKDKVKANPLLTDDKVKTICDCIADKMLTKYKSEKEANKDESGAREIGSSCAMSALMSSMPSNNTEAKPEESAK